jgi:hypothetical protein
VCTHIIMRGVKTHNNGVRRVGRVQRSFISVHAQCGYMLLRDSLVNGVCRVLVHGGAY